MVADKKNQVATSYQRQQFERGRGRANFNCSHGRGKGRPDFDNQRNPRGNKKKKTDLHCIICKRTNHVDNNYWFNKSIICKKSGHIDKDFWYKTNGETFFFLKNQVHHKIYFIIF